MRYLFCIICILLTCYTSYGQNNTKTVDSLQLELERIEDSSIKRVDLLNALGYQFWIIDSKTSLNYGKEGLKIAKDLDYIPGQALAYRVIGVAYWTQGEPELALENLNLAHKFYTELNDEKGMANSLMNSGMAYTDIKDYEKALAIFDQSIEKFTKLGLKERIATTFTKIGSVYLKQKRLGEAHQYLTNALTMHSEEKYEYGIAEAHGKLGELFLEQDELERADHHIRKAISIGKKVGDEDGIINSLILYGRYFKLTKRYAAAEAHVQLALKRANKKQLRKHKLDAYEELISLKKAEGNLEASLNYYETYSKLKDSLYATSVLNRIVGIEFNQALEEKNKELAFLNQKKRINTTVQWILIIGIAIISILSFFLIRSLKLKNKNQQELLHSKDLMTQAQIENQQLKQADLEQQLHFKNKELASYALNFIQKNELLEYLNEKIGRLKEQSDTSQLRALNEIEKVIRQQKNIDKDWEDFRLHFEQVHSGFYKKLKEKHSNLSANDLKICTLARLNLNLKETSKVLGISPESVKTARYRLRKKLNLDHENDLLDYLIQIETK